jgi:hypothetical protein
MREFSLIQRFIASYFFCLFENIESFPESLERRFETRMDDSSSSSFELIVCDSVKPENKKAC